MRFLKPLLDLVYPSMCALCREPAGAEPLCKACAGAARFDSGPACGVCGAALRSLPTGGSCPECRGKGIALDAGTALGSYDGPLKALVLAFKRPGGRALAPLFAAGLEKRVRPWGVRTVVPVPLHRMDFVLRGYNPAEGLAAALGHRLGLAVRVNALRKTRRTPPQKKLPLRSRLTNPDGAFRATGGVTGRVLLVDDVLTTGATLSACARALRSAGASWVGGAVIARG